MGRPTRHKGGRMGGRSTTHPGSTTNRPRWAFLREARNYRGPRVGWLGGVGGGGVGGGNKRPRRPPRECVLPSADGDPSLLRQGRLPLGQLRRSSRASGRGGRRRELFASPRLGLVKTFPRGTGPQGKIGLTHQDFFGAGGLPYRLRRQTWRRTAWRFRKVVQPLGPRFGRNFQHEPAPRGVLDDRAGRSRSRTWADDGQRGRSRAAPSTS